MPHPEPTIDLTDAKKRDLTTLIQAGKPLPEKYRFVLFEDKREVELVWNGKTRDVCTTVLPFQSLEHVNEPQVETKTSPQHEMFDARAQLGRYQVAVKVIDIFGNDTMTIVPVSVG